MKLPVFADVQQAHNRIRNYVHRTPVLTSQSLDGMLGGTFFFKCENFQKVGAFKFRGATNAVLSLSDEEASKGVATHSSGNHAAALALAARNRGIKATIVMPENAPGIKKAAVAGYGAEIIFCAATLDSRESTLNEVVDRTGATFIHPYNNFNVIAGQGTAALELLEEVPDLEIIMAPVGGGGLLSGTAIAAKALKKGIKVIAGEPEKADDAYQSLKVGRIIPSAEPKTIADGLLTSLGDLTYAVISKNVDDIILVSEENIVRAMRMIWERMKIIVEPSAAVPLAAVIEKPALFAGKRTGIILSGGNVDLGKLPF